MSIQVPVEAELVLLPGAAVRQTGAQWAALLGMPAERIVELGPVDADAGPARVARIALAISQRLPGPGRPVVLVAADADCALLPNIGFAQRAAHRPVQAYVMDVVTAADLPVPGATEWPDAPVWVRTDDAHAESSAALRGWRQLTG